MHRSASHFISLFNSRFHMCRAMESLDVATAPKLLIRLCDNLDPDLTGYIKNSILAKKLFPVAHEWPGSRESTPKWNDSPSRRSPSRSPEKEKASRIRAMYRRRPDLLEHVVKNLHNISHTSGCAIDATACAALVCPLWACELTQRRML